MNLVDNTFMRDVYDQLLGKSVVIYTRGPTALGGTLTEWNGYVLHLASSMGSDTYLSADQVVAIVEVKDVEY